MHKINFDFDLYGSRYPHWENFKMSFQNKIFIPHFKKEYNKTFHFYSEYKSYNLRLFLNPEKELLFDFEENIPENSHIYPLKFNISAELPYFAYDFKESEKIKETLKEIFFIKFMGKIFNGKLDFKSQSLVKLLENNNLRNSYLFIDFEKKVNKNILHFLEKQYRKQSQNFDFPISNLKTINSFYKFYIMFIKTNNKEIINFLSETWETITKKYLEKQFDILDSLINNSGFITPIEKVLNSFDQIVLDNDFEDIHQGFQKKIIYNDISEKHPQSEEIQKILYDNDSARNIINVINHFGIEQGDFYSKIVSEFNSKTNNNTDPEFLSRTYLEIVNEKFKKEFIGNWNQLNEKFDYFNGELAFEKDYVEKDDNTEFSLEEMGEF